MASWSDPEEKTVWEKRFKRVFNNICKKYDLSKSSIASASRIDHSYPTLFSRDGRIPTRKVLSLVGEGLKILNVSKEDIISLWLSAGFLPAVPNDKFLKDLVKLWPVEPAEVQPDFGVDEEVEESEVEFTIA